MSRAVIQQLCAGAILLAPVIARSQAIDSVFVEVYHVQPSDVAGEPPLTTYRVFVDLAPEHELQMVYGDEKHQLRIHTTTAFHNDTVNGAKFAHQVNADRLNASPLALDSWLTIGAASDQHMAVPRAMDTDGSILECPPYPARKGKKEVALLNIPAPLCSSDGLMPYPEIREVVNFNFASGYLGKVKGNLLETTNGAWAVLGGKAGVTENNLLLIAQISTTGTLSFLLNLQIETPEHEPVKYVARDPGPDEVLYEGLAYGQYRLPSSSGK
ncbi:MAG: hypothetical protein IPL77_16735 [Flavobacteriales bacterium]|nr:hypothetical protein [Flavobacteriales bacterium]